MRSGDPRHAAWHPRRVACGVSIAIVLTIGSVTVVLAASAAKTSVKVDVKGVNRASVITDKSCPLMVKPYALSDNVDEVLSVLGTGVVTQATTFIGNILSGQKASFDRGNLLTTARLTLKRSNWMPMAAEVAYGDEQHKLQADDILERDGKVAARRYAVADQMLQSILGSLGQSTDYEFKLYVLKNASRNALALPGGYVYIDDGLISDERYRPKAYFALAHEIAHVLQRHETQELQSTAIDSISSASELVGMLKGVRTEPKSLVEHVRIEKGRFTQHHVDEELVADSCATRMLSKALPDDKALAASLRAFIDDLAPVTEVPTPPATASSSDVEKLAASVSQIVDSPIQRHPSNVERVKNL